MKLTDQYITLEMTEADVQRKIDAALTRAVCANTTPLQSNTKRKRDRRMLKCPPRPHGR